MYRVISFITIILISSLTHAENGDPVKIPPEIQEKTEVIGSSLGSINGEQYQVNLIQKSIGSTGADIAISVYKLESSNKKKLVAQSAWWLEHQRWFGLSVKTRNSSVYFSLSGSSGCCSEYFLQQQFKPVNGAFTLIGAESSEMGFEQGEPSSPTTEEGYISYKYGSSVNYLNGEVVHYRMQRPSSSDLPYKDDFLTAKTQKRNIEKRLKFNRQERVLLNNYDIWQEINVTPPEVSCYFNAAFELKCP